MASRDKKTAFWSMTLGVVVLVAVGVTSKDWVLETWYLHKLEHGDEAEKRAAAEKLGEMGSVRAIPGLFEALNDFTSSDVSAVAWSPDGKLLVTGSLLGNVRIWDVTTGELLTIDLCTCSENKVTFTGSHAYLRILSKITQLRRKTALPRLIRALEAEEKNVRLAAAALLGRLGQDAEPAAPALTRASQDDYEDLSHVARDASTLR